jgi:hypothetical protein
MHVVYPRPGRQRAQNQSRHNVAQQDRLPNPPSNKSASQRRGKNHRNVAKYQ